MFIRYINVACFSVWPLSYHNSRHINIEKDTAPVQRIYRNLNLQIFTKWTNCCGKGVTVNVARV
jgi:hypothetical protein